MSLLNVDTVEPEGATTDLTLGAGGDKVVIPGTIKISGGSPGADKVLTSDADGDATWVAVAAAAAGLTQAQQWRLSSNFSSTTSELIFYANWEKPADIEFPGVIATDMDPIPSARDVMAVDATTSATLSGAWTFPVTGTWFVRFFWSQVGVSGTSTYTTRIYTTDDNGSNWVKSAETIQCGHHNNKSSGTVEYIFNVGDTSNDKMRFICQTTPYYTVTVQTNADINVTGATFLRLGDSS